LFVYLFVSLFLCLFVSFLLAFYLYHSLSARGHSQDDRNINKIEPTMWKFNRLIIGLSLLQIHSTADFYETPTLSRLVLTCSGNYGSCLTRSAWSTLRMTTFFVYCIFIVCYDGQRA